MLPSAQHPRNYRLLVAALILAAGCGEANPQANRPSAPLNPPARTAPVVQAPLGRSPETPRINDELDAALREQVAALQALVDELTDLADSPEAAPPYFPRIDPAVARLKAANEKSRQLVSSPEEARANEHTIAKYRNDLRELTGKAAFWMDVGANQTPADAARLRALQKELGLRP
jgi:hypothetical protein